MGARQQPKLNARMVFGMAVAREKETCGEKLFPRNCVAWILIALEGIASCW